MFQIYKLNQIKTKALNRKLDNVIPQALSIDKTDQHFFDWLKYLPHPLVVPGTISVVNKLKTFNIIRLI